MLTCALHIGYLLKRHLYDPGYVQLFQSRTHSTLLVPSMWEHIMHDQLTTGKRSASTALAGTHNLANTDSRAGTDWSFF